MLEFASGASVPILIGVQNDWQKDVQIVGISGDLSRPALQLTSDNEPETTSVVFHNLTLQRLQSGGVQGVLGGGRVVVIQSKEFVTVNSDFKLDDMAEPMKDVRMRLYLDFTTVATEQQAPQWQRVLAFNETISITLGGAAGGSGAAGSGFFDKEALLLYTVILGTGILFYVFFVQQPKEKSHSNTNNNRLSSASLSSHLSTSKSSLASANSNSSNKSNDTLDADPKAVDNEWIPSAHLKKSKKSTK